jgi:hypothetical protein
MSKYKIGDRVWYAERKAVEKTVVCPDCFGSKALTVIKGDGSQVSIGCAGCASGYEPPKGYINYMSSEVAVSTSVIDRLEIKTDKTTYGSSGFYSVEECDIFDTKEEAEARALVLAKEYNDEQLARIYQKEKHNRTWAWNVRYHRDCIKRAEKDIVYHTAKLNAAKEKVKLKEDK